MNKGQIEEKKIIGASYLFAFYREIYSLTQLNANYVNYLVQLEHKYKKIEESNLDNEEKTNILTLTQNLRYSINMVFVQYKSIAQAIKDFPINPDIENIYKGLKKEFIIDRDKTEEFVILINSLLVKGIIKTLLESSQDLLENIYNDNNTTKP